jgi:hypothetical protein
VNPQEESTPLHSLSIDVGSMGAFQIVEPYLLVHVHDRTMSPANASLLSWRPMLKIGDAYPAFCQFISPTMPKEGWVLYNL